MQILSGIGWRHFFLFLITTAVIFGYFRSEWGTFATYVEAVDFHPQFMQDFLGHYYPMSRNILQANGPNLGYFYSSFFAVLLHPVCLLDMYSALIIWAVMQVVCLLLLGIFARKVMGMTPTGLIFFLALLLTSFPVLHNLKWGQVSMLLALLVVAAFCAFQSGKPIAAGLLLAAPVAIKFYPVLFVFYFIVKRDIHACLAFVAGLIFFYCIVPVSVLGTDQWIQFESVILFLMKLPAKISLDENSQYIAAVAARWLAPVVTDPADPVLWTVCSTLGKGMILLSFVLVWQLQRQAITDKYALPMVALFVCTPFFVVTSWPHYFVYLPFGQLAMLCFCRQAVSRFSLPGVSIYGFTIASVFMSSIFLFNQFPGWRAYNAAGMLFASNLALLIALLLVSIFHGRLHHQPAEPVPVS